MHYIYFAQYVFELQESHLRPVLCKKWRAHCSINPLFPFYSATTLNRRLLPRNFDRVVEESQKTGTEATNCH